MSATLQVTVRDLGPVLALILFGFLPNEVWRLVGLMLVRGLDEKSQVIVWVRAVATAMLAGVLAQLILSTSGPLAGIPLGVRVGAAVLGFVAFLAAKRSVFAGVLTGEAVVLLGTYLFAG
jgi:Branched-chain amino acid transport protein (AzlD)